MLIFHAFNYILEFASRDAAIYHKDATLFGGIGCGAETPIGN